MEELLEQAPLVSRREELGDLELIIRMAIEVYTGVGVRKLRIDAFNKVVVWSSEIFEKRAAFSIGYDGTITMDFGRKVVVSRDDEEGVVVAEELPTHFIHTRMGVYGLNWRGTSSVSRAPFPRLQASFRRCAEIIEVDPETLMKESKILGPPEQRAA